MRLFTILSISFFVLSMNPVHADSSRIEKLEKSRIIISEYATIMCGNFVLEGDSLETSAGGDASIKLDKILAQLIKKFIGADISIGGKIDHKSFTNVIQNQLKDALEDVRNCRKPATEMLIKTIFNDQCKLQTRFNVKSGINLRQKPGYNLLSHLKPSSMEGCKAVCEKEPKCMAIAYRQYADGGHVNECHLYGEPTSSLEETPYSVITAAYKTEEIVCIR